MKPLLASYFIIGLFGYVLMYHTGIPDSIKWDIYFVIEKFMRAILIAALFFPSRSTEALKWMAVISVALDISAEFDQIKQQGNYVAIFAHSFGVIMVAGISWAIGENKIKSIASKFLSWVKSLRNG